MPRKTTNQKRTEKAQIELLQEKVKHLEQQAKKLQFNPYKPPTSDRITTKRNIWDLTNNVRFYLQNDEVKQLCINTFKLAPTKYKLARKHQRQHLLNELSTKMIDIIKDNLEEQSNYNKTYDNFVVETATLTGNDITKLTPQDSIHLVFSHPGAFDYEINDKRDVPTTLLLNIIIKAADIMELSDKF